MMRGHTNINKKIYFILLWTHNTFTWAVWPQDTLHFFFVCEH